MQHKNHMRAIWLVFVGLLCICAQVGTIGYGKDNHPPMDHDGYVAFIDSIDSGEVSKVAVLALHYKLDACLCQQTGHAVHPCSLQLSVSCGRTSKQLKMSCVCCWQIVHWGTPVLRRSYRATKDVRNHYEDIALPGNFAVIGDAVAKFNP